MGHNKVFTWWFINAWLVSVRKPCHATSQLASIMHSSANWPTCDASRISHHQLIALNWHFFFSHVSSCTPTCAKLLSFAFTRSRLGDLRWRAHPEERGVRRVQSDELCQDEEEGYTNWNSSAKQPHWMWVYLLLQRMFVCGRFCVVFVVCI